METAIRQLVSAANEVMRASGVRSRVYEENGSAVAQAYVPSAVTGGRPIVITARVAMPTDVVGGKVGRKLKSVAKKIAKSKLLKGIASAAAIGLTGGAAAGPLAVATAAAKMARKLKTASKSAKTPVQKALVRAVARKATANVRRALTSAAPVAQGYPQPMAAELPDGRLEGGNGFGDTDPDAIEQHMDPDQGAPFGSVDVDTEEDVTEEEDTSEDDSSAEDEAE